MTSRYHILTEPAPAHFTYPAKFRLGEGDEYVKYGHRALRPGRRGADPYWTPQIITQTWYQAETGRIPISGAAYGGAFAGSGFDSIWLDMSEIVRPTRDGIHRREYISTAIDLGRKLPSLDFDPTGDLTCRLPPLLELPLPVFFNPLPLPTPGRGAQLAVVRAAARLGTFAFVEPEDWGGDLLPFAAHIAPRLSAVPSDSAWEMLEGTRLVELNFNEGGIPLWEELKTLKPEVIVSLALPLASGVEERVEELVRSGAEVVHLYADDYGCEEEADHRLLDEEQLNGGYFAPFTVADWGLVRPYLEENERLFGIPIETLLTVDGQVCAPESVYRKVAATQLKVLTQSPLRRLRTFAGV